MAFDPDVTPGVLDAFHAWLTKSGVKLGDNIVLAGRSPLSGGRGLTTTKAVENGQQVLAIPQSLGVTAAGVKNSGIAKYLIGYEGWTGDTGVIALQLLWERAQGEKSIMAPWIAAMPAMEELEMPLFWNEEDLALADASSTRVRESRRCVAVFPATWRKSRSVRLQTMHVVLARCCIVEISEGVLLWAWRNRCVGCATSYLTFGSLRRSIPLVYFGRADVCFVVELAIISVRRGGEQAMLLRSEQEATSQRTYDTYQIISTVVVRDALEFVITHGKRTLVYSWCGRLPSCFALQQYILIAGDQSK